MIERLGGVVNASQFLNYRSRIWVLDMKLFLLGNTLAPHMGFPARILI